jgi:hypothetical protein
MNRGDNNAVTTNFVLTVYSCLTSVDVVKITRSGACGRVMKLNSATSSICRFTEFNLASLGCL